METFRLNALEKNNYFYGKLLTVRDFKAEQDYNTEKSCLINRMLFGTGVASGLKTSMIDSHTLSIEPGMAIDTMGRIIVVPKPLTEKLAVLDGFSTYKDAKKLYLCLEYAEAGSERIHSVSNETAEEESMSEYNRVRESYRLKLVDDVQYSKSMDAQLNRKSLQLLHTSKVKLFATYPACVNPGEIFYIDLIVDKASRDLEIDCQLNIESQDVLPAEDQEAVNITFKDKEEDRKAWYKVRVWVMAASKQTNAGLFKWSSSSRLQVDGETVPLVDLPSGNIKITTESVMEETEKQLHQMTTEERTEECDYETLYLARIDLLKAEGVYHMIQVEPMPFNQFVYDTRTLHEWMQMLSAKDNMLLNTEVALEELPPDSKPQIDVNYHRSTKTLAFDFKMPENRLIYDNIITGTYIFRVDEYFKFGKNFVSEELDHGLGKGPVYIHMGLEEPCEGLNDGESSKIYYGAPEAFYKTDMESKQPIYSLGAIVKPNKGAFQIGLRLQTGNKGDCIKVRWWAYKCLAEIMQKQKVHIALEPFEASIKAEETIHFTSKITGDDTFSVIWSVDDSTFGMITENGDFTSSGVTGTVVVRATSGVDSTVSAVAYVTIKDSSLLEKIPKI